jgi:hypothetical protein
MPGRERTDPGPLSSPPTAVDIRLAFAEVDRAHPEAADTLRRAFEALEAKAFTPDLLREVVRQLERSSATMQRAEPLLERGVEAIEAEVEIKRRAVAVKERAEQDRRDADVAGRTTALEHVKGAWAVIRSTAENRLVVGGVFSVITLVLTKLFEGLSAWWLLP